MTYYLLKPCRTATAFISTLKKPQRFPLESVADQLRGAGVRVTDLKVMLVVEGDPELTFYESGKMLVKTDIEEVARSAIERVYRALGVAVRATAAAA